MNQSQETYEQIKDVVREVLGAHLNTLEERAAGGGHLRGLTTTVTDVEGTLSNEFCGPELNQFLCDLIDAGLPVVVLTGGFPKDSRFPVFDKLRATQSDPSWVFTKPIELDKFEKFGLHFDDDFVLGTLAQELELTYLNPNDGKTIGFLKCWSLLTPEDKASALQPWAELDRRVRAPRVALDWGSFGRS